MAQYDHVDAYDVKTNCYNSVYVHKVTPYFQVCCDGAASRDAGTFRFFGFFSFSGGARSSSPSSSFSSYLFALFRLGAILPTCPS